jgi:hypothetical protein
MPEHWGFIHASRLFEYSGAFGAFNFVGNRQQATRREHIHEFLKSVSRVALFLNRNSIPQYVRYHGHAALRMRQSLSKGYIGARPHKHQRYASKENTSAPYRGSVCVPEIVKLPERSFAPAGCAPPTAIP